MGIIEWAIFFIKDIILTSGYPGVFILMALESACVPIPSEIVLPFAGWLVYDGQFDMVLAALAGTFGCLAGSLFAYVVGLYGGRRLVLRYGKYVLLSEKSLDTAERWFSKYGDSVVFFSRLLPIIRTFISLPAGMAKMNLVRFSILTFAGSLPWCFALTYVGYALGPNWESITAVFEGLDILIVIGVIVILAWYLWRRRKRSKNAQAE